MTLEMIAGLGLIAGIACAFALSRLAGRPLDLLDPAYGITALFLLFFGVRPLALACGLIEPKTAIVPESVAAAVLWLGVPGLVAFGIGYNMRIARIVARRMPVPRSRFRPHGFMWAAFCAMGLVALSVLVATRQVSGGFAAVITSPIMIQYALKSGGSYVLLAMSALSYATGIGLGRAIFSKSTRVRDILSLGVLFLVSLAIGYLSGLRANVITQLLVVVGLLHYSWRHRLRLTDALIMGAIGVVAIGGLNALRHYGLGRASELASTIFNPSFILAQTLSVLSPFDGAAFVVQSVREGSLALLYGSPIIGLVTAPIPRAIWPDKPVISTNWMLVEAQGLDPLSNPISTMTMPGELFWQLSIAGVLAGMLLWGLTMRLLYEYRAMHGRNGAVSVIYLVLYFYNLNAFRTSLVTWVIGMLTTTAFLVLLLWVCCGFYRPHWDSPATDRSRSGTAPRRWSGLPKMGLAAHADDGTG